MAEESKEKLMMPERQPTDGPVRVARLLDGRLMEISVETDGVTGTLALSEHNAWRVFGMLALMLEIPLPPRIGEAIKL